VSAPAERPDYGLLDRAGAARTMFHPRPDPAPAPAGASDHQIEVEPGVFIAARYYPLGAERPTVLFFHGNGEVVGDHDQFAPLYHQAGLSLFVAEYRGYGRSGGRPTLASLVADAHPVARYVHRLLDERGCSPLRLVMGRSLGAHPALELAAGNGSGFRGAVIESGAAGLRRMLDRLSLGASDEGARLAAAHEAKLRSIRLPVLQLHGAVDDLVPIELADELYDLLAGTQRQLVVIPLANHNTILWVGHRQYFEALRAFVAGLADSGVQAADLLQLADGVYVCALPDSGMNAGVVVGAAAVAIIDTGGTAADAHALLEAVSSVTVLPMRYVVNTHHHGEQCLGNWWFLPATVIGHARARRQLEGDPDAVRRSAVADAQPALRDAIRGAPLAPPALTFEHTSELDLGGVSLRLAYLGRGHTEADIVAEVVGRGVVFAGDLVRAEEFAPAGESYPAEWGATLRRLAALGAERIVPARGVPVDAALVPRQAAAVEALAAACAEAATPEAAVDALARDARATLGLEALPAARRYFETARA
jgi:glyoxylase-like metal-dependent hydrolase (beta-lactamase superfamily II)/fermentation-respiration switch protein FrsA (DUF1100 family)